MSERWLWWAKRDLRMHDNAALRHIVDSDHECLALFMFEPSVGAAADTSPFHALAQHDALTELQKNIERVGGEMFICTGEVIDVLDRLHAQSPFDGIVSHEEIGNDLTFERDKALAVWAKRHQVQWLEFSQNGVVRGLKNRDERQQIIWNRIWDTPIQRAPRKIQPWSTDSHQSVLSRTLPTIEDVVAWSSANIHKVEVSDSDSLLLGRQVVNESNARETLSHFLHERGIGYSGGISSPNNAFVSGSRLSPHLAWGTLSLRTAFHETMDRMGHLKEDKSRQAIQWRKSLRGFQARLHWHDHFIQRLESEPSMEFVALNAAYSDVNYLRDEDELQRRLYAWRLGQTGIPLVDACMRCLIVTGFLNFRMRAMLVTTACFGFQIHWRELLHPLAQVFADYEPGIHISQIQMQAGMVGINTLRVYSPHKQLLDQDPQASFVHQWVPELRNFTATQIAQYETEQLGDYLRPITDIKGNSKIIKDQLYAIRRSAEGQEAAQKTLMLHGSRKSSNDRNRRSPNRQTKKRLSKKSESAVDKTSPQLSFDW